MNAVFFSRKDMDRPSGNAVTGEGNTLPTKNKTVQPWPRTKYNVVDLKAEERVPATIPIVRGNAQHRFSASPADQVSI